MQIAIFPRTGSADNVIRGCLVRKQGERLDSKTFRRLTKDGCGHVEIVPF